MIQLPHTKPIETKAPARAEVVSSANSKQSKPKNETDASRKNEFSSELKKVVKKSEEKTESKSEVKADAKKTEESSEKVLSDVDANGEVKVQPVQVSLEQTLELPSALINPAGSVETTTPKVFDPALTKDVEQLIHPKLTDAQVFELANPAEVKEEIAQAMLKTPVVTDGMGRAPAIEFAQSEIDPQLLNNEDFVAQKNVASKKAMSNPYGMKIAPQEHQKIALENNLTQAQVVKDASALDGSAVNSQQFILNMMNDQKAPQANETQAAPKIFDMNQVKTSEPDKIMTQITDYIVQSKAAKEPTVNMRVNHEQLGMLDITVTKSGVGQENIAINIGAHSMDGKNFFQQNTKDLLAHMSSAGLNVTDMKVETPSQSAKSEFDFGSQSGKNQHASDKQFGSESGQRRHDQERRQDLWKLLNQEAA